MYKEGMNLILFRDDELANPLPRSDPRYAHITGVLRCRSGDSFDAGLVNGPRGKAILHTVTATEIGLTFTPKEDPPPLFPLTLVVGLARPQTCRDILRETTSLGVAGLCFVATDKGERAYGRSRIWQKENYRRYLIAGAEQAFTTRVPWVSLFASLEDCLDFLSQDAGQASGADKLALDNYEATLPLSSCAPRAPSCILAIGAERGWSAGERVRLTVNGFTLAGLGGRILRTETACIAGITLVLALRKLL